MHPSSLSFTARGILLLAILALEAAGLMYRFDFNVVSFDENGDTNPATRFMAQVGTLKAPVATMAGALLIAIGPRARAIFHDLRRHAARPWRVWLLWHGSAVGLFALASAALCTTLGESRNISSVQLATWFALGGTSLASWLIALAPLGFWSNLARREFAALLAGGVIGAAAWFLGPLAQSLWLSFSLVDATFWLAGSLLGLVYADVVRDAGARILGTSRYEVAILPACSGFEGIFLIMAFLALYLWAFRRTLRFPNAFLLFPLGVLAIWLVNALRIALLVGVGTSLSSDIAAQGFHSQAGWIGFILVAFGLIGLSHRGRFFSAAEFAETASPVSRSADEARALLAPLLALFAATMLASAFSSGFDWLYPAKIAVVSVVIYHFRKVYAGFDWQWSWPAAAIGAGVFLVWMLLEPAADGDRPTALQEGLEQLPAWLAAVWLIFRVLGSILAVPLAEEFAFRGYLIRKLIRQDFENVPPGRFTWRSLLLSSLLFGLLHSRPLAGALAGLGFALALYRHGRLADAVTAHATANALIAVAVIGFEQWQFWS